MEKSLWEKKILELEIQLEEWCGFDAEILQELMNEGSIVTNGAGVNLTLPIEKLNYLIKELENMRYGIDKLNFLYEIQDEAHLQW